jgi:hypothetical protein
MNAFISGSVLEMLTGFVGVLAVLVAMALSRIRRVIRST